MYLDKLGLVVMSNIVKEWKWLLHCYHIYIFFFDEVCVFFSIQFDEQKDQVAVEQILRVVFLDVERPTPVRVLLILSFILV